MIDIFKSIKWDKLGEIGGVTLIFALLIFLIDRFFGIGILPKLTQENAVPILFIILTCVILIAIVAFTMIGKIGNKSYIILFIFMVIVLLGWKMLDKSPRPEIFRVWVMEFQTGKPLDNVKFEIPRGNTGSSEKGLIQFECIGCNDTSFQMTLSKKGYKTEYKTANNGDKFTLNPTK